LVPLLALLLLLQPRLLARGPPSSTQTRRDYDYDYDDATGHVHRVAVMVVVAAGLLLPAVAA
jgi:hypothetical protein